MLAKKRKKGENDLHTKSQNKSQQSIQQNNQTTIRSNNMHSKQLITYQQQQNSPKPTPNPTPNPTPKPTPAPTPVVLPCASNWSTWSACSSPCKGGKKKRTRTIQNMSNPPWCETSVCVICRDLLCFVAIFIDFIIIVVVQLFIFCNYFQPIELAQHTTLVELFWSSILKMLMFFRCYFLSTARKISRSWRRATTTCRVLPSRQPMRRLQSRRRPNRSA
jgi:hypothetical protein